MFSLVFISCPGEIEDPRVGSLSLTTQGSITRSLIKPEDTQITVASYRVTGMGPSGATLTPVVFIPRSFVIPNLLEGAWTITVEGLNANGVAIAAETFDITIILDEQIERDVTLTWLEGTGTLDLIITFPNDITTIKTIEGILIQRAYGESDEENEYPFSVAGTDAIATGDVSTATKSILNLPTSEYGLELIFIDTDGNMIGDLFKKDVIIYKGITTPGICTIPRELLALKAPVFSPSETTFVSEQEITITSPTSGAMIYYTTDGSNPTTDPNSSSTTYTVPLTVTFGQTTIKAISTKSGYANSVVTEETYTVQNKSFRLTFEPQEGSPTPDSIVVINNSPYGTLPTPEREGYTFNGWWTDSTYDGEEITSNTLVNLDSDQTLYAQWIAMSYLATLELQDGTGTTTDISVTFGSPMPSSLTPPSRVGYTFGGYYTAENGKGTQYFNETMASDKTWDKPYDATLFAKWTGISYQATLDLQGGSGGDTEIQVTFGSAMPSGLAVPSKVEYNFDGYYAEVDGGGKQYYDKLMQSMTNWDQPNDTTTLFAKWFDNKSAVTLDHQNEANGSELVNAIYESPMPSASTPSRTGYTFEGFFAEPSGEGKQYYNASMESLLNWDQQGATTLYANWSAMSYQATLNLQDGTGTTTDISVTFGSPMPSSLTPPTRVGYTFGGYYLWQGGRGTQFYDGSMASKTHWDKAGGRTLYAHWIGISYTVILDKQDGTGETETVTATYGSSMPWANMPTREGYTFGGYYAAIDGEGTQYYNASMESMSRWYNLTNAILYAKWYDNSLLTLDYQDGANGSKIVIVTYGEAMPTATTPTRTSYNFEGYYTEPSGGGKQYYNALMESVINWDQEKAPTTLYAKWTTTFDVGGRGPAGGWIFYKKPSFDVGWNYLEAAPSDWNGENDPSQRWGNASKTIKTDQAIGKGKSNTAEIIKEHPGDDNTAAKLCADYSIDKDGIPYDDWFLPSINELQEMYNNLKAQNIGDFSNNEYWSSHNHGSYAPYAYFIPFNEGKYSAKSKGNGYKVRPVRSF